MFWYGLMVGWCLGIWVGGYLMFRALGISNHSFWTKTLKEIKAELRTPDEV